jgi:hypothetical protein
MKLLTHSKQLQLLSSNSLIISRPFKIIVQIEFEVGDELPKLNQKVEQHIFNEWILDGILPFEKLFTLDVEDNIWRCQVDHIARKQ